ncbi:MAG: hypothetical protein J6E31_06450 [Pyramidobacter sp.]|nr:hypothetical protein [Pyramidobacter sp.]
MKWLKKCVLCLTMICLICSPVFSASGEQNAQNEIVDALRVYPGWTARDKGFFLTDLAMKDTIEGWGTARKEADIRQQALEALRDEIAAQTQQMKRDLADLQREISAERNLWRSRVRRGKTQGIVYGLVIGITSGYLVKRNNP